jgi:hypothetical protein
MKTVNIIVGACVALAAHQVMAQSALTDANRQIAAQIMEAGKICVEGLQAKNVAPFMSPSQDTKALLLTPPANLINSPEMRKMNDQQRKVVADLSRTAAACRFNQEGFESLMKDLSAKQAALQADAAAQDMVAKLFEGHAGVSKSMEVVSKTNPDFGHFLHVHGVAKSIR